MAIMIVALLLQRSKVQQPHQILEKITKIIAFGAAIGLSTYGSINAIFYAVTKEPYPGETFDGSLRWAIFFGAFFLFWFTLSAVMDQFKGFFKQK